MYRISLFSLSVAILAVGLSSCNRSQSADEMVASATYTNIKRLAKMYSMFIKNNQGRGPTDTIELRQFIAKLNGDHLKAMGIDVENLDSLFINERDQMPFKIRWNLKRLSQSQQVPLVFEETPSSKGEYQVGFSDSTVKEVELAKYNELWEGGQDRTRDSNSYQR